MTKRTRLLAPLVLGAALLLVAWGEAGHRLTGEAAALSMPGSMPKFFRAASRQLGYINPEPDRWKDRDERAADAALDGAFNADHFIDMDMVSPQVLASALAASNRYGYIDSLRKAGVNAATFGFLPFSILEGAQKLRVDFRNWRRAPDSIRPFVEARIIDDAGLLGHFVADASNPLHATDQYNGWTRANPNGYATDKQTHARFESGYVGRRIKLADIMAKMDTNAHVIPDLRPAIIAYIKASNAQVVPFYELDKRSRFDTNTTAAENKAFTVDRLAFGAKMLRDLWWTAWVTSAPTNGARRSRE